ncbi:predicted protein [Arabidopsis lyrata subsp. lyrata]|uniref:Predicted protein n=1 Tax=Arabidopsis lyrata subsp. lyrata TaxID=81972 RepID=D7KFK8_ARALL|nr:predicted protein [Arabidopsis lyrata subsp. lyrata]
MTMIISTPFSAFFTLTRQNRAIQTYHHLSSFLSHIFSLSKPFSQSRLPLIENLFLLQRST